MASLERVHKKGDAETNIYRQVGRVTLIKIKVKLGTTTAGFFIYESKNVISEN